MKDAFDVHYVDASGNEIPLSEAVKPTGMPAKKPAASKPAADK